MKTIVLFSVFLAGVFSNTWAQEGDLTIVVTNLESEDGYIQVGLYNEADAFPEVGEEYLIKRVPVEGDKVKVTFTDLKEGKYAFGVFHDKDADGECDRNMLGIPTEGYGFSRNFKPTFSAPDFYDCSFTLTDQETLEVKMLN